MVKIEDKDIQFEHPSVSHWFDENEINQTQDYSNGKQYQGKYASGGYLNINLLDYIEGFTIKSGKYEYIFIMD